MENIDVLKFLLEFVLRRSEDFHKSVELARSNPIELSVLFAGAINLFLGVDLVKEHIGVQHELRQGVPVLANNILTELLQYAANLREIIGIGVEFWFRALRRLRLRQRHHQSDRKRAHSVLSQNLLHVELLYVTKRLVLLVTPNAGPNALFFLLPFASELASRFQHRLAPRLRRPQQISCVPGDAPAHWTICREEPVFAGKVTSGVRNETSGQSCPSKVSYNPCWRVELPIAAGHTRYGTEEMDFDPVCVDDCRTVVHGAADRGGEGSRRARQLGARGCDRTRLLERMGGVHTACDCSGETVPVDGAKVCISYRDPHNRVVPDGSPGIYHRILSEPWTSGTPFPHNRAWCATPSSPVHRQCCIDEPHRRGYVLVSRRIVSVDPLLPGRDGAPDSSGATGIAALPCRT